MIEKQKLKNNSRKELTKEEWKQFRDRLHKNTDKAHILLEYINIQSIPKSITAKQIDLSHLIINSNFDHIGLAEIGRYFPL